MGENSAADTIAYALMYLLGYLILGGLVVGAVEVLYYGQLIPLSHIGGR